jgi:hypothetical protein
VHLQAFGFRARERICKMHDGWAALVQCAMALDL